MDKIEKQRTWKDHKGREVLIHTMSNGWLTNISKYLQKNNPNHPRLEWIWEEKRRRKNKRNKSKIKPIKENG